MSGNQESQRKSTRDKSRIDYKELNCTGKKFPMNEATSADQQIINSLQIAQNSSQMEDTKQNETEVNLKMLKSKYSILKEEIIDFIDENLTNDTMVSGDDVEMCIGKVTEFRTIFRTICKEIENNLGLDEYNSSYCDEISSILASIKEYVINAKDRKAEIRRQEKDITTADSSHKLKKNIEEHSQRKRAADFLTAEVSRITNELNKEFTKKTDDEVSDDEITRRKEDLATNLLKMDQLSTKFQRCLEIIPDGYENKEEIINQMITKYNSLVKEKENYEQFIQTEIQEREISKEKSFQVASLNINLSKFSGYESDMDIYTFQREFDKLHLKTTPKKMLSDLLKYNYLAEPALSLVKCMDKIDEIWQRLKKAYGDANTLLRNKFSAVQKIGPLWKIKDAERLKQSLMALINGMSDLISLAKYHGIEAKLYYGDGIDTIYGLMGDTRVTKWLTLTCDDELQGNDLWLKLIKFLEKELKVQQELSLIKRKCGSDEGRHNSYHASEVPCQEESLQELHGTTLVSSMEDQSSNPSKCSFCDETGHYEVTSAQGHKFIPYYSCKKFVELRPLERYKELRNRGFCYMCLWPGASQNTGKHSDGSCQSQYVCKHPAHDRYDRKKHVLVCHEHRNNEENKKSLDLYKSRYILNRSDAPEFAKDMKLSFVSQQTFISTPTGQEQMSNDDTIVAENGIYMLQRIQVGDQEFTIFFDSGCSDMVAKHDAVVRLGERAKQIMKGPISLGGVGNLKTESKHGVYQIRLPLNNGRDAVLAGVCLEQITNTFPVYPINGEIQKDILHGFVKNGGNEQNLPKLPDSIGGDVDFLIGLKYLRYHPEPVFSLPSGLTIFKSPFLGINGNDGVIGGPHAVITEIDRIHNKDKTCQYAYFSDQYKFSLNLDNHLPSYNCDGQDLIESQVLREEHLHYGESTYNNQCETCHLVSMNEQRRFEMIENAASEILYRCVDCRKCQKCRNGERIEYISVKEEVEQDVINRSVSLNADTGITMARLPIIDDPTVRLAPNKGKALAIYNSQMKHLIKHPHNKEKVILSEAKLQSLGHVDYVQNLSPEQQLKLKENVNQNYIPWSVVWKENSLTTPCRIVFNASLPTESKYSLNDILAKGKNNMNMLVEVLLRWRTHQYAFHADIQKMYNSVLLSEDDWCLQRYIWQANLDPTRIPEEKIIKTLIYGVKSSGNQAERALRMTADHFKDDYPEVNDVVQNDMYVDDCLSGENSLDQAHQRADELDIVLMHGGFHFKGFTFTGSDPPKSLSEDGHSVNVAGIKWFPKSDLLKLDIKPLDFSKHKKGQHSSPVSIIPEQLSRRQCLSKVAEIFDLTGMITPITAAMKIDLHHLVQRKLNWDDPIPDDLRHVWKSHFDMMKELPTLNFNRAIIPDDAASLDINTIDCGDASKQMICVAIYARFLRKCGTYSCQLIFSRSKLVPDGMTIPRAELLAANVNAHTGEVVKRALSHFHKESVKLSDSQVVMHWINNQELPLKQWTRNRVVDLLRFTESNQWQYVRSKDNPADKGTRRESTLADVSEGSEWQNGFEWMKSKATDFPIKTYHEIKNECKVASDNSNELIEEATIGGKSTHSNSTYLTTYETNAMQRYEFANYLIDPNKFRFRKVVRIIAIVIIFIRKCRNKSRGQPSTSTFVKVHEHDFQEALDYLFRKATMELKHFSHKDKYEKISLEKNEILQYTGRILPTQRVTSLTTMSDVMSDLSETTFCVPIVDKFSPLALSIINEIHWYHDVAKHSGVETVLRYTMKFAYIIEGRELVRSVRKSCVRCKLIMKRTLDVSMAPVSQYQLKIAPAFYISQTDIVGPFKAFSPHNKRNTLKIWLVVFCCNTTSTTSIKVMEDYCTASFIQAFIRFCCDAGYPKKLLIDEGSQLKKGCETMRFNFQDAQRKLHMDMDVEFETCPVGGHNVHGKVERKIRTIRESIEKSMHKERLSILQWETLGAQVMNAINDLPIALTSSVADLEYADIITPNRLKLGRNNDRSPSGALEVTNDPSKILNSNKMIYNSWFESWLISYVPKLMHHPKWFNSDTDLKKGDVILFLKSEKEFVNDYQYGMIESITQGEDGKVRSVNVKYRNHNEQVNRFTNRSSRQLVVIHAVDEMDNINHLNSTANFADMKYAISHKE